MHLLVIGGTGFIGSWVVRQAVTAGHEVTVLHRGRVGSATLPEGANSCIGERPLSDPLALDAALTMREPDAVIHMVAFTGCEAEAAVGALRGRTRRVVVVSSGDVYRAYGRFNGLEPGPPDPTPLDADASPLRKMLYPYRSKDSLPGSLEHEYEKILVECAFMAEPSLAPVILRLPKVYGAGRNADLATVHRYAHRPDWRWTHDYVENVAAAILLAALHPGAGNRRYNVGEAATPTVAERLALLPSSGIAPDLACLYDFRQDLEYDTRPIRDELGYAGPVGWEEGLRRTLTGRG